MASADSMVPVIKRIFEYIEAYPDWRGRLVAEIRSIVLSAGPDIEEEWKWNAPLWSHNGHVCSALIAKDHVKLNFFRGAALLDPARLFSAGFRGSTMRAIDFHERDIIHRASIKKLVRAACAVNEDPARKDVAKGARPGQRRSGAERPRLYETRDCSVHRRR